jgi:N-acetylmuramate 1-kinase
VENTIATLTARAQERLGSAAAVWQPLTGDASARRYFRMRHGPRSVVLMDASRNLESVEPFIRLNRHLAQLGFSVPEIIAAEARHGLLLLEDFGDDTFARLLARGREGRELFGLGVDALIALHEHPGALPENLRHYHPEKMLEDIELFLQWNCPGISENGIAGFRTAWRQVLPWAHRVPDTLLLRDYHVGNLMFLPGRVGFRRAGLLDFQDAYRGPVTYDLVSLLEDARRDVPETLRDELLEFYLDRFPVLKPEDAKVSLAILAAQRHTRVLAIFARLNQLEQKPEYHRLHAGRVERLLRRALEHPILQPVRAWMREYVWKD